MKRQIVKYFKIDKIRSKLSYVKFNKKYYSSMRASLYITSHFPDFPINYCVASPEETAKIKGRLILMDFTDYFFPFQLIFLLPNDIAKHSFILLKSKRCNNPTTTGFV